MKRQVHDNNLHAHFITFSCYKKSSLLSHDRCKKIVIAVLAAQLKLQSGTCIGYVIMPNHVHAIVWFSKPAQLSQFMKQWKQRSSIQMKKAVNSGLASFHQNVNLTDPVWLPRYYSFNLLTEEKIEQKLDYMHLNPVHAGLVSKAIDWKWGSARHYVLGRSVGLEIGWPTI